MPKCSERNRAASSSKPRHCMDCRVKPGNDDAGERSRDAIRVGVWSGGEVRIGKVRFALPHSPLAFVFPHKRRGGGTPANADPYPPHLAMRLALFWSALICRRSTTAPPQGVFHPKGSASGQASWDAVCTGVTRLRLSQSRDAPPTPVVMPGDMMPKPPGSRLQTCPRAPHPLRLSACLRKASFGERDFAV